MINLISNESQAMQAHLVLQKQLNGFRNLSAMPFILFLGQDLKKKKRHF